MNLTPATFKARFPEFAATQDAQIQMHLDEAETMLDESRWGDQYDIGCGYYVANNLQLQARAAQAALSPVSSLPTWVNKVKVGEVDYGIDTASRAASGTAAAELTYYGQKYRDLARLVGMGAIAL